MLLLRCIAVIARCVLLLQTESCRLSVCLSQMWALLERNWTWVGPRNYVLGAGPDASFGWLTNWLSRVWSPRKHIIGHFGDGFLRVKWPNQQCQSTEGSSSPTGRLQSHQVHLTMLHSYTCTQYTVVLFHPKNPSLFCPVITSREDRMDLCLMSALPDTTARAADNRSTTFFSTTSFSAKCRKWQSVAGLTASSVLQPHQTQSE